MTPDIDIDTATIWTVILVLGAGSFVLRFSFLGMIGAKPLPEWVLRHLRYTAVAVLPGLVAPAVLWPAATGGEPDLARGLAALAVIVVGLVTRNVLAAMAAGAGVLYAVIGATAALAL
ncbi:AzlD domain-containing protein [Limimaricola pyoseonensis]|uniref:Branched-chain amino acid transport protein n=1 Tax=Limimaricola pyoseonensis TaxID=521013 RepID=A0A1G7JZE8_9RHOB|nr:AzlD domain-containing protein [Limimaricola pyoseonensis]SDF30250.1 Branched-chain amino acid transport protein [Limimaricola pyoseonensis]